MSMLIYERLIINACLILFLFSIMFDAKLTPVVCGGPPTYLYEWVDGMQD